MINAIVTTLHVEDDSKFTINKEEIEIKALTIDEIRRYLKDRFGIATSSITEYNYKNSQDNIIVVHGPGQISYKFEYNHEQNKSQFTL